MSTAGRTSRTYGAVIRVPSTCIRYKATCHLSFIRVLCHIPNLSIQLGSEKPATKCLKGKTRANEVQETDDDAYGSDDPSYLPNARAGDEREEDGTT